jgi:penicillin-binding protein 1A
MSRWSYSDEELDRYFKDPSSRRGNGGQPRPTRGLRGFWHTRFESPRKAEAAFITSILAGILLFGTLALFALMLSVADDLPLTRQLENPEFQLATVAYTADGQELQRYAFQNRSWVSYDEISPHIINGLLATEDHRFYDHWGIDIFRTVSAVGQTVFGRRQGGSTITQQLARNLYNEEIGKEVTVQRKMKEMVTSVRLERRYTKREIIEMYLNTVEFVYNAFGIEAAAQTFFSKSSQELEPLEAAVLVGMLQNPVLFNPVRFHDRSQGRRNVILRQMVKHSYLTQEWYDEHRTDPISLEFRSSELTAGDAPYFAEYVRNWLRAWGRENGYNIYTDGLVVHTTLDSRMQEMATAAVTEQMEGLQAVVDYEWSRPTRYALGSNTAPYREATDYTPFDYFWRTRTDLVNGYIRDTDRFRSLRAAGTSQDAAITQLRQNTAFMDSLRAIKTRLEAGLVSIDPRTGYVKAWVGGRDLSQDWYDHVAIAKRQPGSTFKPFVYVAAIDNGYSPNYMLPDTAFVYRDPRTGQVWAPRNVGAVGDGYKSLAEGLATSDNIVTARVITQLVDPAAVAFYARRMGVKSRLDQVPSLALGVSDVSLLEMTAAYSTLANGGLYHEPTVITRIEDRFGNVLYESLPNPQEALSESTAYTVVDMMRGAIQYGTAQRIRFQFGLGDYDLAGKTGTTQESADGWFMLMHPDLVTGAWVGFNDRRIQFRSIAWGQGGRNALLLVGDFMQRAARAQNSHISQTRFPSAVDYGRQEALPVDEDGATREREVTPPDNDRRVGW